MEPVVNIDIIKELKPGDVVFRHGNYGVVDKTTVERVTKTQAILANGHKVEKRLSIFPKVEFPRNAQYYTSMIPSNALSHYRLHTDELEREWFKKESVEYLGKYNWNLCDHDTLVTVINALPKS